MGKTILVTTSDDTVANDGKTSLREAVAAAASGDTIKFASNVNYVELSRVLEIGSGKNLTISGTDDHVVGLFHQAGSLDHLLLVDAKATVTVQDMILGGDAIGGNSADGTDGDDGDDGKDGLDGTTSGQPGAKGKDASNASNGTSARLPGGAGLGSVSNYGTLRLDHIEMVSAAATGGFGGDGGKGGTGGNGGSGGDGASASGNGSAGGNGADGGLGSSGGDGGNGSHGGDAVGAIYNAAGASLTIADSVIHDCYSAAGDGGKGGDGGNGGGGGNGGSGGPGTHPGNGGNGGNADNGGHGGNGGAGGSAVGGILNDGTLTVEGGVVLYNNEASAGDGGDGGAGGTGGVGGTGGGAGGTTGIAGKAGDNGTDGDGGSKGKGGTEHDEYANRGTIDGQLTVGGHFFELSSENRSPSTVLVGARGAREATTVFYDVKAVGDRTAAGYVRWRVITGSGGPTAADFVGGRSRQGSCALRPTAIRPV